MTEEIKHNNQLLAIIISHKFDEKGIHFFTPEWIIPAFGLYANLIVIILAAKYKI